MAQERGRLALAAVNAAAEAGGLSPGLPLADARALQPDLRTADHDPAGDGAALLQLADWCSRYTPWSAPCGTREGNGFGFGGAGGLMLDVTGCCHLFAAGPSDDGEAALLQDLLARLTGFGFAARAALADTPGAAWALARFAGSAARPWVIAPVGGAKEALMPLPPAALRLSDAEIELTARFGLRRVAELLRLPPAALAPRFGPQVARRLAQALGREGEAISPRQPVPEQRVRRLFAEPAETAEVIANELDGLLAGLCRRLESRQLGARRLELICYRVDVSLQRLRLGTSQPSRDPAHLKRLFDERLGEIDPGFGIEALALGALASEPLGAVQIPLERKRSQSPGAGDIEPAYPVSNEKSPCLP